MKNWLSNNRILKIIPFVFLLTTMVFSLQIIRAQEDTLPKPITLKSDEYNKNKTFVQKLIQPLKFKENKKKRVYKTIEEFINKGELNIDSNVNILKGLIDTINLKIASLDKIEKEDSDKIASLIKSTLDNKVLIDSLNKKIDNIKKQPITADLKQTTSLELKERERLLYLKSIKYNCNCINNHENRKDISQEECCLIPKKKIIGWHKINKNSNLNFKNYNFNYLSVLNLESYELDTNGTAKNVDELEESEKIIDFAKKNCTDVYLTVHNTSKEQVSTFLRSQKAQITLFESLKHYSDSKKIIGANIFFENINSNDSEVFVQFIRDLNQNFKNASTNFELTVTIPAVYNRISLEKVEAYDFLQLNEFVTNYIVLTNKMIWENSRRAAPNSPLQNENDLGIGTIESAIDFYGNGKIPLSKLLMSVSYLGTEWPVVDFTGKVKNLRKRNKTQYNEIQYNVIQELIQEYRGTNNSIAQNFDPNKATAYLNITEDTTYFEPPLTQIWYENSTSLRLKYEWMLENNLAGVSIFGLGYDDGYTDLWDALALTLITTNEYTDTLTTKDCNKSQLSKKYDYNFFKHLSSILTDRKKNFFDNFQKHDSVPIASTLLYRFKSDYEWSTLQSVAYKTEFYPPNKTTKPDLLNNEETCACLLNRWFFYSYSLFIVSSFLLGLVVFLSYSIYRFNKYREKISPTTYENYKSYRIVLLILAYILILIGLFLYPNEPLILGKNGIIIRNLVIIVSIGFSLGVWGLYTIFNGSYIKKDMP